MVIIVAYDICSPPTTSLLNSNLLKLTPTVIFSGNRTIDSVGTWNDTLSFSDFGYVAITVSIQGWQHSTFIVEAKSGDDVSHSLSCSSLHSDGAYREWIIHFKFSGRYLTGVETLMSYNRGTFATVKDLVYVTKMLGLICPKL